MGKQYAILRVQKCKGAEIGAMQYHNDLAHGNPISDTDTSGWFGGARSLFFANYVRKIM